MRSEDRFISTYFRPVIAGVSKEDHISIDLSVNSTVFDIECLQDPDTMERKIHDLLAKENKKVAFGGYLERRKLYERSEHFSNSSTQRSIHLGVDFWCERDTPVCSPQKGIVHSFTINDNFGDYGPTIVLEHQDDFGKYFTLYGHLTAQSLKHINNGDVIQKGESFAAIGSPEENGSYAPHLHFQLILDMEGSEGDYPGVSSDEQLSFYKNNCPDPLKYLGLF